MTPRLGDRVRWTHRAGRYYYWDAASLTGSNDPDACEPDGPWVTSKDGIPQEERDRIVAAMEEGRESEGHHLAHGSSHIHVWEAPGEGVLVGKTHRETFERAVADDGETFIGMSVGTGRRTNFWEVKEHIRGRRWLVPLDGIEVITEAIAS